MAGIAGTCFLTLFLIIGFMSCMVMPIGDEQTMVAKPVKESVMESEFEVVSEVVAEKGTMDLSSVPNRFSIWRDVPKTTVNASMTFLGSHIAGTGNTLKVFTTKSGYVIGIWDKKGTLSVPTVGSTVKIQCRFGNPQIFNLGEVVVVNTMTTAKIL